MKRRRIRIHSRCLGIDTEVRAFIGGGIPVLAFPTQDGMSNQWEDFGMIGTLAPWIDTGRISVFCVDTVDIRSWSNRHARKDFRSALQEKYFHYITEEVVPAVREAAGNPSAMPLATGCSMGGAHAALCLLRRPDLFGGVLGLSGAYDARYFTGGYMDPAWAANSGVDVVLTLPEQDAKLLRQRTIALCCGRGPGEETEIDATMKLEAGLRERRIDAWVDWWGTDVSHDWPWWKAQLSYFLPYVLEEMETNKSNGTIK